VKKFDFEKLEFVDSFVVFLDILGFRELVMNDDEKQLQKINFYFTLIEEIYFKKLREELEELNQDAIYIGAEEDTLFKLDHIIISDSIIITMKMFKYDTNELTEEMKNDKELQELYIELERQFNILNKLAFEKLCEAIIKIQRYLASQNVWLRGAISAGTTHISQNKKQIVGKAYIKAYELEGKAKYPRVILDSNILEALNIKSEDEFIKSISYMFSWKNTSLQKDIPLFLDYVGFLIYMPTVDNQNTLHQIIESCITGFEESKGHSYHDKYFWSLEYIQVCLNRGGEGYLDLLNKLNEVKINKEAK